MNRGLLDMGAPHSGTQPPGWGGMRQPPGATTGNPAVMAGEEEASNVTPEEQAQYEGFVDNGYKAIYGPKGGPEAILERIAAGDPVDGLARTTVMLVDTLEKSAKQAGKPLSGDVLMHGGKALLEEIADLAEKKGVARFNEQQLEQAFFKAVDLYGDMKGQSGEINPQTVQDDLGRIQQMDRSGQLRQMMGGRG
ncbi:MAG: hypothetical protein HQL56_06930 [Magnetococcales bacterium]|nr:hypothetical protein [Magnetococcales bacterium]